MTTPETFTAEVLALYRELFMQAWKLKNHREAAEDLVQETMLRAFAKKGTFDGKNLRAWLYQIMRNRHWDECRNFKHASDKHHLVNTRIHLELGSRRQSMQEDRFACQEALEIAFNETNGAQEMLMLAMGYTQEEIAEELNIPIGTVGSRSYRAREYLMNLEKETLS